MSMPPPVTRVLLVGCGKMGSALLKGWSAKPYLALSVLEPHDPNADYQSATDIPAALRFHVVVMAVKPQVMADVLVSIKHLISAETLVISIAAGKTLAFFENILGTGIPVIRSMPNTPAAIGKGITVLCGNAPVSEVQKNLGLSLLSSVGEVAWVADENLMDAVTAVSGSGPAYVFLMIEAMADAGIKAGLSPDLSMQLARSTVIGAGALAENAADTSAATLRQNVTSPGGTTEAALKVLMSDDGLTPLMTRAIRAAQQRGKELAG